MKQRYMLSIRITHVHTQSIFWIFLWNELLIQPFVRTHCFRTQFTTGIMQINATNGNGANTKFVLIATHAEHFPG